MFTCYYEKQNSGYFTWSPNSNLILRPKTGVFRGTRYIVHVIYDNYYHSLHVQYNIEYREKHRSLVVRL